MGGQGSAEVTGGQCNSNQKLGNPVGCWCSALPQLCVHSKENMKPGPAPSKTLSLQDRIGVTSI